MSEWLLLVAAVVLTAGTALFVTAEFSLVALDRSSVQRAVDAGDHRAEAVLGSLRRLSTQLSAAQVGITLTTLVVGYLAEPSLGSLLAGPLGRTGLPGAAAETIATTAALIVVTVFSMIFGELVPQFLGISTPLAAAKVVALPVRVFGLIAKPLIVVLNGSANRALRAMGVTPQEELSAARAPQELASLIRRSADQGTLAAGTARRLTRSLDFGDRTAADVMTPRVRASAVAHDASAADVLAAARRTGYSRFPVTGDGWDDVLGMVHVKSALSIPYAERADTPVAELMTPASLVPETIRLDPLLRELRTTGLQLAVVLDEFGGTSGVVTLEDVVEEIVGEVSDEHDRFGAPGQRRTDGTWSVSGLWRPDEVRDQLGAAVPDSPEYETLGGYVMAVQHRIPQVGDEVVLPGWTLRVLRMDGRRVDRILFVPTPDDDHHDHGHSSSRGQR